MKCGVNSFCVGFEGANVYCYGAASGCMWGRSDCSTDTDCSKYSSSSAKYTDGDTITCPDGATGWRSDACTCSASGGGGSGHRLLKATKKNAKHRQLQLAGLGRYDSENCGFQDLSARAQEVDMHCCPTAADGDECANVLPSSCSYNCAATFVPFLEDCASLLSVVMADVMPQYRELG